LGQNVPNVGTKGATKTDIIVAQNEEIVAEASEKYWRRAKDPEKLFAAVATKISEQAKYVVWRDGMAQQYVEPKRNGKGGKISVLKSYLPTTDPGDVTAHRWRKKFCERTDDGKTIIAEIKMQVAIKDAQRQCQRIREAEKISTVRGTEGTGEFERYTPGIYIDLAREVLGAIDLDPATCAQAQQTVRAARFFTEQGDGLQQEWYGRVWLNPPYHRQLAPAFIAKLNEEYVAGPGQRGDHRQIPRHLVFLPVLKEAASRRKHH
jgi:hypothetical protein